SGDKDLKQLLDDNVVVTDPGKGIKTKTLDFVQEYLFEPKYILDYLALIGDSADNIKGVPGIGPKGASTLIQKYKTIENIYDNIDEITGGTKDKLIAGKEEAFKSKKLIELEVIPKEEILDIEKYKLELDFNNYKEVLVQEYNFASMEKGITELKNKFHMPQQSSLF
ncbi:MAG TPA: 5'-3' exonuclease H3TH domain-containing protein, partial [Candidatus Absconditabacterales bacterium]|nr:5'-3' exonuclease H3TH domain-containing protein [Candidatus Absconditabacterales bacterium]